MENIIDRLLQGGYLDSSTAEKVSASASSGIPLDEALITVSGLPEEQVLKILSAELGLDYVDLENNLPQQDFLKIFPARVLLERKILPLKKEGEVIVVATSRIFESPGLDELRIILNLEIKPVLAPSGQIERALRKLLGVGADTVQSLISDTEETRITVLAEETENGVDLSAAAEDASIVKFVNQVLKEAIELRATDVHFEPFEHELRVRYRIDGVLQAAAIPAEIRRFQAAIVSRLKILSSLDIAEKRLPQDGRIKLMVAGREIDVRVSVIPMLHGEAVVLRLLDRSSPLVGLAELGMSERDRQLFDRLLELPHGIILVTGPTGSGKTTTLYAGLSKINTMERKIITIEDPIEYHLTGVNQIQVQTKSGLTFARGLRSILRHDPDVILVGEIRDLETAEIAVQASLTGHLVFSTLHTNDAPGAPTRLVDMGVEPYLVASSLEAVMAQRLVRLICPSCKEEVPVRETEVLRKQFGDQLPPRLYRGRGCPSCQGTGYRGRTGIFELLPISDQVRSLILARASAQQIRAAGVLEGMRSLREDGWRLVREGKTTLDEVLRVTKDERSNGKLFDSGPIPV